MCCHFVPCRWRFPHCLQQIIDDNRLFFNKYAPTKFWYNLLGRFNKKWLFLLCLYKRNSPRICSYRSCYVCILCTFVCNDRTYIYAFWPRRERYCLFRELCNDFNYNEMCHVDFFCVFFTDRFWNGFSFCVCLFGLVYRNYDLGDKSAQ